MIRIAYNLRRIRRQQCISGRELARKAGVQPSTITRIEQGKGITLDAAVRIARALNVTLDELVLGQDQS